MKNLKTIFVIALLSIITIGFQSCSAEEVEVPSETQNTNINGGKS